MAKSSSKRGTHARRRRTADQPAPLQPGENKSISQPRSLENETDPLQALLLSMAAFPAENPNPVLRIGGDGTLLYANEASYALLGDWHLKIGKPAPAALREGVRHALDEGTVIALDQEHLDRVFSLSIAPVLHAGYANVYGRDITSRKQAEVEREQVLARERAARAEAEQNAKRIARLQAATAALSGALTPTEIANVIVQEGADAFRADAGLAALMNEAGDGLTIAASRGYPQALMEYWHTIPLTASTGPSEAVRTGQPVWLESLEEVFRRFPALPRDRVTGLAATAAIPLMVQGRAIGAVAFGFVAPRAFPLQDRAFMLALGGQCAQALERARLYEAEQQARREAEAAVRLRDQFLTLASHELRTPLTAMKGYAEILQQRAAKNPDLDELDRRAVGNIHRQTQRLDRMIAELLDISRIEAGHLNLELGRVDVVALVEQIVRGTQKGLRQHHLRFTALPEPLLLQGDEHRITELVENLIQNAIKYSPLGGSVDITLAGDREWVTLEVCDQGIGIPKQELSHLFERFFRATNAEAYHIAGLGIGLYVAREIARLHGGDITVESEDGRGSTFTVTLPRARPASG